MTNRADVAESSQTASVKAIDFARREAAAKGPGSTGGEALRGLTLMLGLGLGGAKAIEPCASIV